MTELISGIIGGIIVLIVQKIWDKIEKRNKNSKITPNLRSKKVPDDILTFLQPGISVEKVKQIFGAPDHFHILEESDLKEFYEIEEEYNSFNVYQYHFSNAIISIGSLDNLMVDSISIFCSPTEKFNIKIFENKFDSENLKILGKSKITAEIIDTNEKVLNLSTARERLFGLRSYYGRYGNYFYYTYYFRSFIDFEDIKNNIKPSFFEGETIIGFSVSNNTIPLEVSEYDFM